MQSKVGIVVLNYNTPNETFLCVDSIKKYCRLNYVVYIVDNNSEIDNKKKLCDYFEGGKNVRVLLLDSNLGYSGGNNYGIKCAVDDGCEYFLIVNSDIEFKNDIVSIMEKRLLNNVGIVGPRVFNLDGDDGQYLIKPYSFKYAFFDRMPFHIIAKYFNWSNIKIDNNGEYASFYGMVSGCCFMFKKDLVIQRELFDDNVFLYSEERILSKVLKENNILVAYEPDAVVLHKEGVSTGRKNAFSDYHRYASDYYTVVRYCKPNKIQINIIKFLRLFNFKIKSMIDETYKSRYVKLRKKFHEIDTGNFKIKF